MRINIAKKFPSKYFKIIKRISETADKERVRVCIVGGPVRDILLGVSNYDLDFIVERDSYRFCEILSKNLKAKLKIHRPFGTATIECEGIRIDFASLRAESYKRPAAYPDVRPGTIKEDLKRRDFTINAMAISVNKKDFGELVDFYGGLNDLKKGIIRVMHDKSFIDDPTRIFRAVRFAVRFNFKIDPHTKALIKKALLDGLLGKVNRGRIRKEIEFFLKEKDPGKCLDMFAGLI